MKGRFSLTIDLLHFLLDGGQILVAELHVAQVDVVVEALLGGGTVGEMGVRVDALHGLGHDMRGGMAEDFQFLLGGAFGHVAVVVDDLHDKLSFFSLARWPWHKKQHSPHCWDECLCIRGSTPLAYSPLYHGITAMSRPPSEGGIPKLPAARTFSP